MKSGAGDDPFADDPFDEADEGSSGETDDAASAEEGNETPTVSGSETEAAETAAEESDRPKPERSANAVAEDAVKDERRPSSDDTSTDETARTESGGAESSGTESTGAESPRSDERPTAEAGRGSKQDDGATASGEGENDAESHDIPWVLRRSRVKEDRDNVHQFFLRDEYSKTEDDIIAAVAEELDVREKQLKKLDVREAMVATADAEAIAETLSEWGYEYVD